MKPTQEEYQHALEVLQESLPYNLQRRDPATGVWRTVGKSVRGRSAAHQLLNNAKASRRENESEHDFRVLPKNEADKYREGLSVGLELGEAGKGRHERDRKPLVYLPEHL